MKSVLVIVVTHNGKHWLDRCLGSVSAGGVPLSGTLPAKKADFDGGVPKNGTLPAVQADLYVWDNDSTDGSADFVAANYPKAHLVRSADNLGFAQPNNAGMQYALDKGYDYVYLLNQDAWLEPGALETLVAVSQANPDYAVLSPLQMTDEYKELDKQFAKRLPVKPAMTSTKPAMTSTKPAMTSNESCPAPTGHPLSVPFVMAAHWLVPVKAIREIGLFDQGLFPMWGQDDDWCNRARYKGYKIGVVPEARAAHDRQYREEPKEKLIKRNYYIGSLVRLCDLNRPLWERFMSVCLFTLVKTVKYCSILPLKYFRTICSQLPEVKEHRKNCR